MSDSKHDQIAKKLAEQNKAEYNKGPGPDIKTPARVIEVATSESDLYSSLSQVNRFQKPKYFATTPSLLEKAKKITKGTGIGVMGPNGSIQKRSRRKH